MFLFIFSLMSYFPLAVLLWHWLCQPAHIPVPIVLYKYCWNGTKCLSSIRLGPVLPSHQLGNVFSPEYTRKMGIDLCWMNESTHKPRSLDFQHSPRFQPVLFISTHIYTSLFHQYIWPPALGYHLNPSNMCSLYRRPK